ncbi:MAG: FtsX-like permease family protein [Candidatus Hodarchaeales archaeon]|jgi:ABC-type lipoprotein release transport system permease subunit
MILTKLLTYRHHFYGSKRNIIIAGLSLAFALSILASSLIYIDSMRNEIFLENLEDSYLNELDYSFNAKFSLNNVIEENYEDIINNTISSSFSDQKLNPVVEKQFIKMHLNQLSSYFHINSSYYNYEDDEWFYEAYNESHQFVLFELSPEIEKELVTLSMNDSTIPKSNDDIFILHITYNRETLINPYINDSLNILSMIYQGNSIDYDFLAQKSISGIGNVSYSEIHYWGDVLESEPFFGGPSETSNYPHLQEIARNAYANFFIFTPNIIEFINSLDFSALSGNSLDLSINGYVNLDYEKFDAFSIRSFVNELNLVNNIVTDQIYKTYSNKVVFNYFFMSFNNYYEFLNAEGKVNAVLFNMFIYSLPILTVSTLLAGFSFGLIQKAFTKRIESYKLRGISNYQLSYYLIADSVLTLIVGVLGGIIIGIFLAIIILRTDNILSFQKTDLPLKINISSLIRTLSIFGLTLTVIINGYRSVQLLKTEPNSFKNIDLITVPLWKKYYLDFLSLGLGLIGTLAFSGMVLSIQDQSVGPLIILALISPLLIIVGLIFVLLRLYILLMEVLAKFSWNYFGGLFSLALKTLNRNQQHTTKVILMLSLVVATLVTFLTLPYSTMSWEHNKISYDIGAEGRAIFDNNGIEYFNNTILKYIEQNLSEHVDVVSPYLKLMTQSYKYPESQAKILAINTTTFEGATLFPLDPQLTQGLTEDLSSLKSTTSENKILINSETLSRRKLNVGDLLTLTGVNTSNTPVVHKYTVLDSFEYWPTLLYKSSNSYYRPDDVIEPTPMPGVEIMEQVIDNPYQSQMVHGIIDLQPFIDENITLESTGYYLVESGYYLNLNENGNTSLLKEILSDKFSLEVMILEEEFDDIINTSEFLVGLGQLNSNVIISFLIVIVILATFEYIIFVERRTEIFTERAIGLSLSRAKYLLSYESAIIVFSGLLLGNLLGFIFTNFSAIFVILSNNTVPFVLLFPMELIFGIELIFIIFASIQLLILVKVISKMEISQIFTGEN